MISPPNLQKGELVAFAAPARSISNQELQAAINILLQQGFRYRLDDEVLAVHNQFAGNAKHRTDHFQRLLDDPDVKAIFCVRGGYGSLQIIDQLDLNHFKKHPKWIVGYSDITVLHARFQSEGFQSLHATMPVNMAQNTPESLQSLFQSLHGSPPEYTVDPHPFNRMGEAKGKLLGGNLSMLYSLMGSGIFPKTKGNILFVEDVDEYLYHLDRMMLGLKRAGAFDGLSGMIVGGLTKMNDNTIPFGQTAEEIIAAQLAEFSFPVCFGFPAGHLEDNRTLVLGKTLQLSVEVNAVNLSWGEYPCKND